MFIRNLILTLTGLAVGATAAFALRELRERLPGRSLAWVGVSGILYIVGRYVVYPQTEIPYTALVAWFASLLAAVSVGWLWDTLSGKPAR